jgi:hypothetical protein
MSDNGSAPWGYAFEQDHPLVQLALRSLRRAGLNPAPLPGCDGQPCQWAREVAECLRAGTCRGAVIFCADACLTCCVANKVPGVRAAAAYTVAQARRAVERFGANLLAVEPENCTYFEIKQILTICCGRPGAVCPPGVACVLEELDGHAHR